MTPLAYASGEDALTGVKQAGLRDMRRAATALLCVMLALLLISIHYQSAYSWLHWVRAAVEAAVVGAIADWYAVIALFRHPFGIPLPHTAIIPNLNCKECFMKPPSVSPAAAGRRRAWVSLPFAPPAADIARR